MARIPEHSTRRFGCGEGQPLLAALQLPFPLAVERLSWSIGEVLFGELGLGLSNHQDREDDHRQQADAEQHPV